MIAEHGGGRFMNDKTNMESINNAEGIEVTGYKPGEQPGPQDSESGDATPENPYNELGFGFTAYFNMLQTFICIFLLFTVIMLPALYIYGRTDGLLIASNPKTAKAKWSLGNLGFSGSTCISQYVELSQGPREIVCLQGTLGEMYSFGILPSNFVNDANKDQPTNDNVAFENGYAFCGQKNVTDIPEKAQQEIITCTNDANFNS